MSLNERSFEIEFVGKLCYTCGFHDYFDDYKVLLVERGSKTKITGVNEGNEGFNVYFEILELP